MGALTDKLEAAAPQMRAPPKALKDLNYPGRSDKLSMSLHGIIVGPKGVSDGGETGRLETSRGEWRSRLWRGGFGYREGRMFDVTRRQAIALGGTGILSAASIRRGRGHSARPPTSSRSRSTSTFPRSIRPSGRRRSIRPSRRSTAPSSISLSGRSPTCPSRPAF